MFSFAMFCIAMFFLIGVHEYGHYIVAIKTGIKVEKFFIGFGPTLFSWIGKNGVEFGLKLIPFGGFVKMSGESPENATGEDDDYFSQPVWKRISVAAAGPFFNFFFAIALFIFLGLSGITVTSPVVGHVEQGSIADIAGIETGDRIVSIDNNPIRAWKDMNRAFQDSDGLSSIDLKREGRQINVNVAVKAKEKDPLMTLFPEEIIGFFSYGSKRTISSIVANSPASDSELRKDFIIISINKLDDEATVVYKESKISPEKHALIPLDKDNMIGIVMHRDSGTTEEINLSPIASVKYGFTEAYYMSKINLMGVYKLITNKIPVDNIGGPILIADYAGKTANMGFDAFIAFLAAISIALGIMNLLPIPALDGGLIVMYAIEWVRGKSITQKTMENVFKIGYGILLCLISLAIYNDLNKYIF